MKKEDLKAKIREYLNSNRGYIDRDEGNIEEMANRITEIVCETVQYDKHMEALDRSIFRMRSNK